MEVLAKELTLPDLGDPSRFLIAGDNPERWIYDGIHPTAAGQWLIAQRWLEVVAGIQLPSPHVLQ